MAAPLPPALEEYLEENAPHDLKCPLSLCLMTYPVILVLDGRTYDREQIEAHIAACQRGGWVL